MANQQEKDEFFRHLDSLEDGISSSEEDRLADRPAKFRKIVPARSASNIGAPAIRLYHYKPITKAQQDHRKKVPPLIRAETDIKSYRPDEARLSLDGRSIKRTNSEPKQISVANTSTTSRQALFEGCRFYFIPNNDVAKIRRLRIQSAISLGAHWIRYLNETITHVIVDAHLTANSVTKSLGGKIDLTTIPILKDKWLIESISQKVLKDVRQSRFLLEGMPALFDRPIPEGVLRHVEVQDNATITQAERVDQEPTIKISAPNDAPSDELTDIMKELKETKHMPLDAELDLDKFISLSSGDEGEDEPTAKRTRSALSKENRGFACMEPHTGKSGDNPNNRTIEILQMMATYYDRTGDHWRTTAYRKAIAALRKQNHLVRTKEQALKIFGIGNRLANKIEEIVTTDRLQKLESTLADPSDKVLQLFMGVYGAGVKQSRLWIDQGFRTLEDLKVASLTDNQKVGIEHYDDFQQRIPRAEVAQHGAIVQEALHRADKRLTAIVGGSYRRGMPDSGDIDVMITHDSAELPQLRKWVFEEAVPYLFRTGFMKYAFATSRSSGKQAQKTPTKNTKSISDKSTHEVNTFADSNDTGTKLHGASALPITDGGDPSPWRRIDLLLVPASALGASLLYFTGNDIFNRSMRLLASRKGMRLNQYGLYKNVLRGKGRIKETEGELLEGQSEKRIFEILGVPWREPEERRC